MQPQLSKSPWEKQFLKLISEAKTELVICSPFINTEGVGQLAKSVHHKSSVRLIVLTSLTVRTIANGATEPQALLKFYEEFKQVEISNIRNLHAKVYIIDDRKAIVTSANLTSGGISRNLEYGIILCDPKQVSAIRHDLRNYQYRGDVLAEEHLRKISKESAKVREQYRAIQQRVNSKKLSVLLKTRKAVPIVGAGNAADEGETPDNRLFTNTILKLLKTQRLKRAEICSRIRERYPERCDDTHREPSGQIKWKHRISAALENLYEKGKIGQEAPTKRYFLKDKVTAD